MKNFLTYLILLIGFIHCNLYYNTGTNKNIESQKFEEKKIENKKNNVIVVSKKWNNLKFFFIGKEVNDDPVLREYQRKQWYVDSIKAIQTMQMSLDRRKDVIEKWHRENLQETNSVNNAVYLLSGADLYHFILFYPNAENYIMLAMENTGAIDENYKEEDLKYGIINVQNILSNLTHSGYLFSRTMYQYMIKNKSNIFSGTLPVLLYFIGYFGYDIIDVQSMCLAYKEQNCIIPGLKYQIVDKNQKIRNLFYFSKKLSPEDLKENSELDVFFKNYPHKGLFLKAAVYLLHYKHYQKANEYLVKNFDVIVQDDSGIPYSYIKNAHYQIKLFGVYKDPTVLKETINPFQKDLEEDIKKYSKELPFSFGYAKVRKSGLSNLIYAYRN